LQDLNQLLAAGCCLYCPPAERVESFKKSYNNPELTQEQREKEYIKAIDIVV
jgi:hypothetical protein